MTDVLDVPIYTPQPDAITAFTGEFRFLSNFYPAPIRVTRFDDPGEWRQYPTVEHAYQALKARDLHDHHRVWGATSAAAAKRIGRQIAMRPDWDRIKVEVMRALVYAKFHQNSGELSQALLATGDRELVEGNTWGDQFWGVCGGRGRNELGRALMDVRRFFRTATYENWMDR